MGCTGRSRRLPVRKAAASRTFLSDVCGNIRSSKRRKGSNVAKESRESLPAQALTVDGRNKHAPKGGIERELLAVRVGAGMTIAEIAAEVGMSKATVRYWMRRYGLRSRNRRGPRTGNNTGEARSAGLATFTFKCRKHGETTFVLEGRGYYRCKECRSERISRRRRRLKEILALEAGGRCRVCGYDRYLGALQFHHLKPEEKRLGLAAGGLTLGLETLRVEARKCVLLCSNCHVEVEAGLTSLPGTVRAGSKPEPDTP